jgi:hypothetical protein
MFALGLAALVGREPVVNLRLEAPFDELANVEDNAGLRGRRHADRRDRAPGPVKISVRGHTSRRETGCVFRNSRYAGGRTTLNSTHCGEETGDKLSAKYGRLPNESRPGEVAICRSDALGVRCSAQSRRVTYLYPDGRSVGAAMIVEDDDAAADGRNETVEPEGSPPPTRCSNAPMP